MVTLHSGDKTIYGLTALTKLWWTNTFAFTAPPLFLFFFYDFKPFIFAFFCEFFGAVSHFSKFFCFCFTTHFELEFSAQRFFLFEKLNRQFISSFLESYIVFEEFWGDAALDIFALKNYLSYQAVEIIFPFNFLVFTHSEISRRLFFPFISEVKVVLCLFLIFREV